MPAITDNERAALDITIKLDGNAWCAFRPYDFQDLQQSIAGFGDTPVMAVINLLQEEIDHPVILNPCFKTCKP